MITLMKKESIVAGIIMGFAAGLIAQFIWKMIYFPEPIIPVIIELVFILTLAIVGCYCSLVRR